MNAVPTVEPNSANFATVTPLEDAIWQAVSAPSAQPQSDAEPLLTEEEIAALPPAVQAIERERISQAAKSSRARSLWRPSLYAVHPPNRCPIPRRKTSRECSHSRARERCAIGNLAFPD